MFVAATSTRYSKTQKLTLIFPWNIRENPKFPHFVILNIRRSMGAEDPAIEGDPEGPEDGADGAEVGHVFFGSSWLAVCENPQKFISMCKKKRIISILNPIYIDFYILLQSGCGIIISI